MTGDIDDFADDLRNVKLDDQMQWAAVRSAEPMTREAFYESVDPSDDHASDEGLAVTFELASGDDFDCWWVKPDEWVLTDNLVLLLATWGLDPGDLSQLNGDDETWEVPVTWTHDGWQPDWERVEERLRAQRTEGNDE